MQLTLFHFGTWVSNIRLLSSNTNLFWVSTFGDDLHILEKSREACPELQSGQGRLAIHISYCQLLGWFNGVFESGPRYKCES